MWCIRSTRRAGSDILSRRSRQEQGEEGWGGGPREKDLQAESKGNGVNLLWSQWLSGGLAKKPGEEGTAAEAGQGQTGEAALFLLAIGTQSALERRPTP